MYVRGTTSSKLLAVSAVFVFAFLFIGATDAEARSTHPTLAERVQFAHERQCNRLEQALARAPLAFQLPAFCTVTPPPPPPVDLCPLVIGMQEVGPCVSDLCVLPATWSVDTQACVAPPPPPPVGLDHVVISEVYYDADDTHGTEPAHEWIELYNPTASAVDLGGWSVIDTAGSADTIPDGTTIPAGGYVVLAATSTLSNFWAIPVGAVLVNMGGTLGNGLGNTGDSLVLRNAALTTVDALSWGTDVTIFAIAAPDVAAGHSLARSPVGADTDLATDWVDQVVPTPGQ